MGFKWLKVTAKLVQSIFTHFYSLSKSRVAVVNVRNFNIRCYLFMLILFLIRFEIAIYICVVRIGYKMLNNIPDCLCKILLVL